MTKFFIIASGYNCKPYVQKCIESVAKQTYDQELIQAIFISDGSTDGTENEFPEWQSLNMYFARCAENKGAAFRRYNAVKEFTLAGIIDDETVIVLLGLDDELLPNALERINKEYEKGKWMSYGNWVNQYGKSPLNITHLAFDAETHRKRDYRKVKYRSTAPNTFKKFLFDAIPESDFKMDGRWIDSTTESEVMFSCLEMCGKDRIGIIVDPIYMYNEGLPGGTLKRLGVQYKYDILAKIMARPKKPLYERREK